MGLLGDFVLELVFGSVGEAVVESPPRVRHTLVGFAGLSLAAGVSAALVAWPAAEDRPVWAVGLTVLSLLYGAAFGVASGLALANDREDRGFALLALLGCLAAAALPLVSMAP